MNVLFLFFVNFKFLNLIKVQIWSSDAWQFHKREDYSDRWQAYHCCTVKTLYVKWPHNTLFFLVVSRMTRFSNVRSTTMYRQNVCCDRMRESRKVIYPYCLYPGRVYVKHTFGYTVCSYWCSNRVETWFVFY